MTFSSKQPVSFIQEEGKAPTPSFPFPSLPSQSVILKKSCLFWQSRIMGIRKKRAGTRPVSPCTFPIRQQTIVWAEKCLVEEKKRNGTRQQPEAAVYCAYANPHVSACEWMRVRGKLSFSQSLTHRPRHPRQTRRRPAPAAPALRSVAQAYRSSPSQCCWAA